MSYAAPEPKANQGQPAARIDGRAKVTGQAPYAADFALPNLAYGFLVTSGIARGKVTAFDLGEARQVPGVLEIITYQNMSKLKETKFFGEGGYSSTRIQPLSSNEIHHDGQIIAVVVADTFEGAREAAFKVKPTYETEEPTAGFDSPGANMEAAKDVSPGYAGDLKVGDAEKALQQAHTSFDGMYETPTQHHNAIELFSTTCKWEGDRLTVYEPSQFVCGMKNGLAEQLDISADNVRVLSPFVGGAFGSKGSLQPHTALAAIAARRVDRPVKLVVTRDQGFTTATYRAETRHHLKLGAAEDGRLSAFSHEGWEVTSRTDGYLVGGTNSSARLYHSDNIATKVSVIRADRNTPGFMRSPPEMPYIYALETAMDELAVKLKIDPVELRRVNDSQNEPVNGNPYTSRSLMPCFDQAAKQFGWSERKPEPASMTDGDWQIGYGCAATCYPSHTAPAAARVKLTRDGRARVEIAVHDVGTGAYTVIAQMAAEQLGIPLDKVEVALGDSDLPPGPVAGGSNTTASACNTVMMACRQIMDRLAPPPLTDRVKNLIGVAPAKGASDMPPAAVNREAAFDRLGVEVIEEYTEWKPDGAPWDAFHAMHNGQVRMVGGEMKDKSGYAFGAEFVEVRVHKLTREIRVPRATGAFAAGHIMNTRTAHSQLMGGMIWGISSALFDATEMDRKRARYVNDNLADYLVPVNADIGTIDVSILSETDNKINPAGIKGLGELGNVGTAAAISNAVYHATGKRFRKLPIRIEDLIGA